MYISTHIFIHNICTKSPPLHPLHRRISPRCKKSKKRLTRGCHLRSLVLHKHMQHDTCTHLVCYSAADCAGYSAVDNAAVDSVLSAHTSNQHLFCKHTGQYVRYGMDMVEDEQATQELPSAQQCLQLTLQYLQQPNGMPVLLFCVCCRYMYVYYTCSTFASLLTGVYCTCSSHSSHTPFLTHTNPPPHHSPPPTSVGIRVQESALQACGMILVVRPRLTLSAPVKRVMQMVMAPHAAPQLKARALANIADMLRVCIMDFLLNFVMIVWIFWVSCDVTCTCVCLCTCVLGYMCLCMYSQHALTLLYLHSYSGCLSVCVYTYHSTTKCCSCDVV